MNDLNYTTFSGTYYFTVDPKGRIIIPAGFRDIIRSNFDGKVFIANGAFDRCLSIYPRMEWLRLQRKADELPQTSKGSRWFQRWVIGSGQEIEVDRQGRILIPSSLRENSGIRINGEIVIVGLTSKIELWDRDIWNGIMENDVNNLDGYADELKEFRI